MDKKELQMLFNQGKYEKIYEFFRNNLPKSPDEYNLKALSCFYMGYTNEAISTLKNGLIAFPKNKDILFNLVEILYNNKEFEEALKYALKAIEVEEENYVYYDIIANIYFLKDDLQNAYLYAEKAKKYAPPHVVEQLVLNYSQFEKRMKNNDLEEKKEKSKSLQDNESKNISQKEGLYIALPIKENKFNLFFSEIISPIKSYKIIFCNRHGNGYGDSPKYIAEEIIRQGLNYDMVWLLKREYIEEKTFPTQIRVVEYGTLESLMEILTARIIINNDTGDYFNTIKRKNQIFFQTWHGGIGIKKICLQTSHHSPNYTEILLSEAKKYDYMISNSAFCTNLYREAFSFKGKILEFGTPRNDILFNTDMREKASKKVKTFYQINNDYKILIYAPTFRKNKRMDVYDLDYNKLRIILKEKFGGEWKVIVRFHPYISSYSRLIEYSEDIINASDYDDVCELISAGDILITDYSSLMFEFSFMKKPVFLYTPDWEEFRFEQGVHFEIEELPFETAKTNEELFLNIRKFDNKTYESELVVFLKKFGLYENGDASKKMVNFISQLITNKIK